MALLKTEELITGSELASRLGITYRTLIRWRKRNGLPSMTIEIARIYRLNQVFVWMKTIKPRR